MRRREFLRVAGVGGAAAAAALSPAGSLHALLRSPAESGTSGARVRYCAAWGEALSDARALACGDPRLAASGVRLSICGFAPDERVCEGAVSLDVLFPAVTRAGAKARFHAWSHDARGFAGPARANSFVVPLDDRGALALDLTASGRALPIALSVGSEPGLPKLRRGVYVISPPLTAAGAFLAAGASPASGTSRPRSAFALVATVDAGHEAPRSDDPWKPWRLRHA